MKFQPPPSSCLPAHEPMLTPLPVGIVCERMQVERKTGLVAAHLPPLQGFARRAELIIAFRPVEQVATGLIQAGYPTKNFHVKGKSANWGPMAGFIAVQQALSKLAGDTARIAKFNRQVEECLNLRHAVAGPLFLRSARMEELEHKRLIVRLHPEINGAITLQATAPDGAQHLFAARKTVRGDFLILYREQALQVLCQPESLQPLTADYDLMLIAPRLEHYGAEDKSLLTEFNYSRFQSRARRSPKLQAAWPDAKQFFAAECPELGNASARLRNLIPQLNRALGCARGRELVHHSMDATNPTADISGNYPVTVFLPQRIGALPEVLLITDVAAFKFFIAQSKNAGYQVPVNPLWEAELQGIRRENFNLALNLMRQRGP